MKKILLSTLLISSCFAFTACNENVMKCNDAEKAYQEQQKECDIKESDYIDLKCDKYSEKEFDDKDCTDLFDFYAKAECKSVLGIKAVAGNLEELPSCKDKK